MYLKANAAAIWKRRKELGMTQLQVAQKAGIGSMSLTRMENEKTPCTSLSCQSGSRRTRLRGSGSF